MSTRGIIFGILGGAAGLATVVFVSAAIEEGRCSLLEKATNNLTRKRSDEENEIVENYNKYTKRVADLAERETAAIHNEMEKFKESIGFNDKLNAINNTVNTQVNEYKQSIGYDELTQQFKNDLTANLDSWKSSHDYNSTLKGLEDKIAEIKRVSKNQKNLTSFVTFNSDYAKESADKLSEMIDSNRDESIKEVKEKIKTLEGEFKSYREEKKKEYDQKLKDLDRKVESFRNDVVKNTTAEKVELNKMVEKHRSETKAAVEALRTPDESNLASNFKACSAMYDDLMSRESQSVREKIESCTTTDYICEYLKKNNYSVSGFCCIAALPIVPVCGISYIYFRWVLNVIRKLKEN